ncbi:MAG TPA: dTDP-4-dehydrorhamnose 3,5-epimerase [candidate division Zixibacteria bacterium]|nr:dTDP-4-dehydrorhamnose 3,5-epimerase [candidate division Zixibacteria bacterium]
MIQDVKTKQLKVIPDARGRLMEVLRNDDDIFGEFGQVYITTTLPDVVKAWHFHKCQTDNFACVQGTIQVALFDARKDSPTFGELNEFVIGVHRPMLISVPPGVYHGWKCVGLDEAIIVNIPSKPYNYKDPDEHRLDWDDPSIPYDWTKRNG